MTILLKKWYMLIIFAVIGGIIAVCYTHIFITPKYNEHESELTYNTVPVYCSETKLYVTASNDQRELDEITNANIDASKRLVNTYIEILSSRDFLTSISEGMEEKYDTNTIKEMLTMECVNDTQVLLVVVKGENPEDVYLISQLIAQKAPKYLTTIVGAGSIKVVESPVMPESPILQPDNQELQSEKHESPDIHRNLLIGVILGFILGGLFVYLLNIIYKKQ